MVLTITGTIKTILMHLKGMEAYYGDKVIVCTVIDEEKGEKK